MKIIFIVLLSLFIGYNGSATEQLLYYVYVQTTYSQGPWNSAYLFENDKDYDYLDAKLKEDLFGSDATEMARIIFTRLQNEDKIRFEFSSNLSLSENGDTVIISTTKNIDDFEAVKNELVATFIFNNFKAVKIIQGKQSGIYRKADISVPYMDLVLPEKRH